MARRRPLKIDAIPDMILTHNGESIRLSPDDMGLILQRMILEGQLHVFSPRQDWLCSGDEIQVEVDADGRVYLTPCDGSEIPAYLVRSAR